MKYTKEQAHYEPRATGCDHCDDCQAFIKGDACAKVEGQINSGGWCQLYVENPEVTIEKQCSCGEANCSHDEGRRVLDTKEWKEHETVPYRYKPGGVEIVLGPTNDGKVPANPFASIAQQHFLHAHPEKLGKKGLAEWDAATKGKHLPKRVKSYEHGTNYVPETGPAILHRGERVIPARKGPATQKPERHADAEDGSRDMKVPDRRTIPARKI